MQSEPVLLFITLSNTGWTTCYGGGGIIWMCWVYCQRRISNLCSNNSKPKQSRHCLTKDVWPQEASSCTHKDLISSSHINANAFEMYWSKKLLRKKTPWVSSQWRWGSSHQWTCHAGISIKWLYVIHDQIFNTVYIPLIYAHLGRTKKNPCL